MYSIKFSHGNTPANTFTQSQLIAALPGLIQELKNGETFYVIKEGNDDTMASYARGENTDYTQTRVLKRHGEHWHAVTTLGNWRNPSYIWEEV